MRTTLDNVSVSALSELLYPLSLTRYVKLMCMTDCPQEEVHAQAQSACKSELCMHACKKLLLLACSKYVHIVTCWEAT